METVVLSNKRSGLCSFWYYLLQTFTDTEPVRKEVIFRVGFPPENTKAERSWSFFPCKHLLPWGVEVSEHSPGFGISAGLLLM